jgi:hypothetical protein
MLKRITETKGVVTVFAALTMLLFLGLVALVVDLGFGITVRTQLHQAADAAALAGASQLDGTLAGIDNARNEAIAYGANNSAAGSPVTIAPADVEFGWWDMLTRNFNPILPGGLGYPNDVNAVRVAAQCDGTSNSAVPTSFARALGRPTMSVRANAVASKGGPSRCVDSDDPELDCDLDLPMVLCSGSVTVIPGSDICETEITVYSDVEQDGGFTSFFQQNASVPVLNSYVDGETPDVYARPCSQCPANPVIDNQSIVELDNGVKTPVIVNIREKYEEKIAPCVSGGSDPACEDLDGDGIYEWVTYVAVVCCNSPDGGFMAGTACITGFARFNVEEVCVPDLPCQRYGGETGHKALFGLLKCGGEPDGGNSGVGGLNGGTFTTIPGLVQ